MRGMSEMNLHGTILVQYTKELGEDLKTAGTNNCVLSLEQIKNIPQVEDAWFTRDAETNIIVRINVKDTAEADEIKNTIAAMDDIMNVRLRVEIDA